ncbi:glycoside hydrolase family 127 protein [Phocaeicola paurosaccharolyticus]|uniref:glycoside hydrolase family 127 protein n=1 Tax=Phocaeicola paurosaccharolyticus TaxID=732242 RepID=UPI002FE2F75B
MNLLKTILAVSAVALIPNVTDAQLPVKAETFPVSDVRVISGPFKHAEDMDIRYLLGLDPDRLLAPYLKGAGLTPKAENYTNWENTGLDGHIGGHYLSALSYMYAATGNKEIKERLDYMISEMKRCQDSAGDGYLSGVPDGRKMWKEIEEGKINASGFGLNNRWVPLYNIHKTFAGLRDAYLQTGNSDAKEMLVKLTDWMMRLVANLSDEQMQDMLRSEHGGLNEVFADVADITKDKKYLKLAHKFSHQLVLQPLLNKEDKLTGMHANTQIPKVIGYKRIADLEGNKEWDGAAEFFWKTVVNNRSISIGGNSEREHFHPVNDFSSMLTSEQGPETCNTYNMLRLTKLLYQTSLDSHYMDYYERALYNHILSTQDPVQGGFVYFTPMRSGHYRVYSQPQTSFWCCVGSGMENHAKYGEMIYAHKGNQLYVNLFISSTLNWDNVNIEQKTDFPNEEGTNIIVTPKKGKKNFELLVRVPGWAKQGELTLMVNDKPQNATVKDGYVSIQRTWEKGDKVKLSLPMSLHVEVLPDNSSNYSLLYGPIVLASQLGKQNQDGLFADDSRGGHIAAGPRLPLQDMPVIIGDKDDIVSHIKKVEGKPLTFTLSGVYPKKYDGMTLEPFYRLYECRYMVYWPVWSQQELNAKQEQLAKEESERAAIDKITSDKVICGEQQPESDHFIQMDKSQTGNDDGKHWREAEGWFSYKMKSNGKDVNKVRVLFNSFGKRSAKVLIDGTEIGTFTTSGTPSVSSCEFEIPASMKGKEEMVIKIEKNIGRVTPHIYEVRLIAQ